LSEEPADLWSSHQHVSTAARAWNLQFWGAVGLLARVLRAADSVLKPDEGNGQWTERQRQPDECDPIAGAGQALAPRQPYHCADARYAAYEGGQEADHDQQHPQGEPVQHYRPTN
jgi:hypothetical protein